MRPSIRGPGLSACALVAAAAMVTPPAQAHEANPSRYNYREDVRPIFVKHCASCHRPGGIAPMSLLEFQEAVPWANAIKMQLLEQTMPPWLPVEGIGEFRHSRSLTAEEVDIIVDWAVGETPEGEPLASEEVSDAAPASTPSTPSTDVTLEPEASVVLTEEEFEKVACVVYPVGVESARVVSRFVVDPELRTVLRRATIYRGTSCDEGAPLATWLPDQPRIDFPRGSGVALSPSDSLAVELSYVKGWEDDGKRLEDRTRLGLTFDAEAQPIELVRLEGSSYELEGARRLLALYAEPMSAEASTENEEPLRIDAVLPGGERRALLVIERYDPAWREKYLLETPLALPAGAELQTSRPGIWVDFARAASSLDDDDES